MHVQFHAFFDGLLPDFAKQLVLKMQYCKIMKEKNYQLHNVIVLKAGKVPRCIYFVRSDSLQIGSVDSISKYISLGQGGVYGEAYALFGCPASYTLIYEAPDSDARVAAEEPGTETYKVDVNDYMELLRNHAELYPIMRQEALNKRRIYRKMKREYLAKYSEISGAFCICVFRIG